MPESFLKQVLKRKHSEHDIADTLKSIDKLDLLVEKLQDCRQIAHDLDVSKDLELSRFRIENSIDYSIKAIKELKFKMVEGDL